MSEDVIGTAAERVACGATFMDEQFPGWVSRVNPEVLDIDDGRDCVFGQVLARRAIASCCGYHYGVDRFLGGSGDRATELGLLGSGIEDAAVLTDLWKEAIAARV